jgi:hypothetical protein
MIEPSKEGLVATLLGDATLLDLPGFASKEARAYELSSETDVEFG